MRVLMLLSNPYRPDYRVEREAKALLEEGHEIRILAWDREGGHKDAEVVGGVSVLRFGPRALYNDPFDMFVKLPLFLWRALLKSRNLDFDVVHAHDFDTLVLGRILSKLRSVKLVYDAHELYWAMVENSVPGWLRKVVERFERRSVSRADIVLTVTPQVASVLESYGAKEVVLVMNCEEVREPDAERIGQVRKAMLGKAGKLALCAGMLEPSRNMQMLIDIFAGLEGPDIKLVVGGTGSLVSEISRAAEEAKNVDFIGWIPSAEMFDHISASDIIILIHDPRNTNIRLGISARLFNAMAAGKPVIVSDGTGNADIAREEGIGVVVPFDDADEVKSAILSLVEDEGRLADIAEKGRRAAKERYNWGIMKRRLIRAYRDLGAD
ncbi:MAG: glycosyltransferase family 4 protein [Thermoplasmata archaeon]